MYYNYLYIFILLKPIKKKQCIIKILMEVMTKLII